MNNETREQILSWLIFTKEDVRRIAEVLHECYRSSKGKKHHSALSYEIVSEGGSSWDSDSPSIFDDGGPLDLKKTLGISMHFHDYQGGLNIDVSITEASHYSNRISVRGRDPKWVRATFTSAREILDSVRPQNTFVIRHKKPLLHLIALGVGSGIILVLSFVLDRIQFDRTIELEPGFWASLVVALISTSWTRYLVLIWATWAQGMLTFAYPLHGWLLQLWPEIEFDFGPEHKNRIKTRRQRLNLVATLVVVPILVNVLTRLLP
jgi:hypothetical protein